MKEMLLSNALSRPEMRVPMSVTERMPMMIPSVVRRALILFDKIAERAIRRFSRNLPNTPLPFRCIF